MANNIKYHEYRPGRFAIIEDGIVVDRITKEEALWKRLQGRYRTDIGLVEVTIALAALVGVLIAYLDLSEFIFIQYFLYFTFFLLSFSVIPLLFTYFYSRMPLSGIAFIKKHGNPLRQSDLTSILYPFWGFTIWPILGFWYTMKFIFFGRYPPFPFATNEFGTDHQFMREITYVTILWSTFVISVFVVLIFIGSPF